MSVWDCCRLYAFKTNLFTVCMSVPFQKFWEASWSTIVQFLSDPMQCLQCNVWIGYWLSFMLLSSLDCETQAKPSCILCNALSLSMAADDGDPLSVNTEHFVTPCCLCSCSHFSQCHPSHCQGSDWWSQCGPSPRQSLQQHQGDQSDARHWAPAADWCSF